MGTPTTDPLHFRSEMSVSPPAALPLVPTAAGSQAACLLPTEGQWWSHCFPPFLLLAPMAHSISPGGGGGLATQSRTVPSTSHSTNSGPCSSGSSHPVFFSCVLIATGHRVSPGHPPCSGQPPADARIGGTGRRRRARDQLQEPCGDQETRDRSVWCPGCGISYTSGVTWDSDRSGRKQRSMKQQRHQTYQPKQDFFHRFL